jgi:hypothetical protein
MNLPVYPAGCLAEPVAVLASLALRRHTTPRYYYMHFFATTKARYRGAVREHGSMCPQTAVDQYVHT